MKALTIWQPWASLVAIGAKPLEFRGWAAPRWVQGRRIAIHAGARAVRRTELLDLVERLRGPVPAETGLIPELALPLLEAALAPAARGAPLLGDTEPPAVLPLSSILCTAILGCPVRDNELMRRMGLPTIADSDRLEHTNWGWPLTEIQRLAPIAPARGAQGFWDWDEVAP